MKTLRNIYINKDTIDSNLIFKKVKPITISKGQTITVEEGYFVVCKICGKFYNEFEDGTYKISDNYEGEPLELFIFNSNSMDIEFDSITKNNISIKGELSLYLLDYETFVKSDLFKNEEVWSIINHKTNNVFKELKVMIEEHIHTINVQNNPNEAWICQIFYSIQTKLEDYGFQVIGITLH